MSIKAKEMPPAATILGALDIGARKSIVTAQQAIAPIVSRETPRKTGQTAAALRPRLSRTATGAALTVGAPRRKPHGRATIAQVLRWLTRGTGEYRNTAGPKKPIRSSRRPPRRMVLPGGAKRWSVKGQHPNPFMARIQALGTLRVQQAAEEGAKDTARDLERLVG